jgi:hypothetical protein
VAKEILLLMKEVAVDCTLNVADNIIDNEPYKCLNVEEGSNPYMFDPELERDEITTGTETVAVKKGATTAAVTAEVTQARQLKVPLDGVKVSVIIGEPDSSGIAPLYAAKDLLRTEQIGTIRKDPGSKTGWSNPKSL